GSEFSVGSDEHRVATSSIRAGDVADVAASISILTSSTDTNNATRRAHPEAGIDSHGYVSIAGGVIEKRTSPQCRVAEASGIERQCRLPARCVALAGGVATERATTERRVASARGVALECLITVGGIRIAGGVTNKGECSVSRVVGTCSVV